MILRKSKPVCNLDLHVGAIEKERMFEVVHFLWYVWNFLLPLRMYKLFNFVLWKAIKKKIDFKVGGASCSSFAFVNMSKFCTYINFKYLSSKSGMKKDFQYLTLPREHIYCRMTLIILAVSSEVWLMEKLVCKCNLKYGVICGEFFILKAGNCKYEIWEPLLLTSVFLVSLCSFLPVLCCSGCWRLGNNGISVVRPRLVDGPWVNSPPAGRMPLCCCIYGYDLYECDVRNTVVA